MATQLKPTDYQPVPAPRTRPNVHVAFSTSAATQAIVRGTDALPLDVRESTLDELANDAPVIGRDPYPLSFAGLTLSPAMNALLDRYLAAFFMNDDDGATSAAAMNTVALDLATFSSRTSADAAAKLMLGLHYLHPTVVGGALAIDTDRFEIGTAGEVLIATMNELAASPGLITAAPSFSARSAVQVGRLDGATHARSRGEGSATAGEASHTREAESTTDEALIAELREKGLEGPITADFLASFRQEREFMRLGSKLEAIPDGVGKLKRALVRAGVLPPEDGMNDKQLLDAFDRWMASVQALKASGPDATEEDDALAYAAMDIADDVILDLPAVTPVGALVKLRRALHIAAAAKSWVEKALLEQNDTELFARAEELDVPCRLIIDAIAAIVRTNSDRESVA